MPDDERASYAAEVTVPGGGATTTTLATIDEGQSFRLTEVEIRPQENQSGSLTAQILDGEKPVAPRDEPVVIQRLNVDLTADERFDGTDEITGRFTRTTSGSADLTVILSGFLRYP